MKRKPPKPAPAGQRRKPRPYLTAKRRAGLAALARSVRDGLFPVPADDEPAIEAALDYIDDLQTWNRRRAWGE